jgi:hypothetical protein
MNRQIASRLIFASVLIAAFAAFPAYAQGVPPSPPHAFFGTVTVNGQPAPVGAQVEARGPEVLTDPECNPIAVSVAGRYGGPTGAELKLCAQGDIADDTPIQFFVDGVKAQCAYVDPDSGVQGPWGDSYPFESGVVTQLNLMVGGATPTASSTVVAQPAGATSTFTPTSTTAASVGTTTEESVVATATRQTPQSAEIPSAATSAAPAASPMSAAASLAATATAARNAVVATPTTPAAPIVEQSPTETPTVQPTATPSATPEPAMPTARPTVTLTPALVAQAPRAAASNPIIEPGKASAAGQTSAPATSRSGGAASGRMLALWGGLAALAMAIAAGVLIWVRGRSR